MVISVCCLKRWLGDCSRCKDLWKHLASGVHTWGIGKRGPVRWNKHSQNISYAVLLFVYHSLCCFFTGVVLIAVRGVQVKFKQQNTYSTILIEVGHVKVAYNDKDSILDQYAPVFGVCALSVVLVLKADGGVTTMTFFFNNIQCIYAVCQIHHFLQRRCVFPDFTVIAYRRACGAKYCCYSKAMSSCGLLCE